MSRLDYFASAAMQGMLAQGYDLPPDEIALLAVQQARALMEELDKPLPEACYDPIEVEKAIAASQQQQGVTP